MKSLTSQQRYYAALVPQLAEPFRYFAWKFSGFKQDIKRIIAPVWIDDFEDDDPIHVVPDAHCLDKKNQMIYALEIIETNEIHNDKAFGLDQVAWALDEAGWNLACVLYYPQYVRTAIVPDCWEISLRAECEFKERRKSYRDAFTTLRAEVPTTGFTLYREGKPITFPTVAKKVAAA